MKLESFQLECFQLESFHLSWKPLTLVKNFPIERDAKAFLFQNNRCMQRPAVGVSFNGIV